MVGIILHRKWSCFRTSWGSLSICLVILFITFNHAVSAAAAAPFELSKDLSVQESGEFQNPRQMLKINTPLSCWRGSLSSVSPPLVVCSGWGGGGRRLFAAAHNKFYCPPENEYSAYILLRNHKSFLKFRLCIIKCLPHNSGSVSLRCVWLISVQSK